MIFFTCPEYFPGVKSVFRHAESLGLGRFMDIASLSSPGSLLKRNISTLNEDDLVIFGGWDIMYLLPIMRLKCRKAILWTSSTGQMEMSPNGAELNIFTDTILRKFKEDKLYRLYIMSRELYRYLRDDKKVEYFPPPFDFRLYEDRPYEKVNNSIGLFIPPHSNVRKNYYNQKLAIEMLRRERSIIYFTNAGGWLPEWDYYRTLRNVVVNLHVTHSESFCYQVAEAITSGTISLVSPCIQENLCLDTPFVVHNPDSPTEICEKIEDILGMREGAYTEWVRMQHESLKKTVEKNNNLLRLLL